VTPAGAVDAALAALREGEEERGLTLLAPVIAGKPRNARAWQVKALLHRSLDDLAPALAAFEQAAALAPTDTRIALGRAQAAAEAGLPAVSLFDRAAALAPGDPQVIVARAAAQLAEGQGARALAETDCMLAAQPGWIQGHWLAARLRHVLGQADRYTLSLDQALGRYPGEKALWHQLLFTLAHARDHDAVLAAIARGRQAAGGDPLFDLNEAAALSELGRHERADRAFAALPAPTDTATAVLHLRHLLRTGRPADLSTLAERFVAAPDGHLVRPYQSVAWRLLDDPRWTWLEGDARLVGIYDLADRLPPLDTLAERLRSLHIAAGTPLEQSVRRGSQTDGPLLSRVEPEIRALRAAIVEAVARHIAQLPPADPRHPTLVPRRDRRIRFAGAWSVRLLAEGYHAQHVHPQGWFSSALYIALPDAPAPAGWLALGQPDAALGLDLPPIRMVEPKPGRLVLFPSTMWHGTVPFAAGERLTVAFDVAPPR
jgi:hypothetical protein